MPVWMLILVKFNLSLAVVWIFYRLFLRRLTFYGWNRIFLVVYPAICFIIPFVNINPWLSANGYNQISIIQHIPSVNHLVTTPLDQPVQTDTPFSYPATLALVLAVGSTLMGARLLVMYFSLLRIRAQARLLVSEPVGIYETRDDMVPFSFGNEIFIPKANLPEKELEAIIRHEFIHVKQKHSFDIFFAELVCMVAWYNPFAWLIRHAIRQNLEFIADNQVVNHGTDIKTYQYLLLKVTGQSPVAIGAGFNLSSLKNRLIMLNKSKSGKSQLLKFLLSLPIVVILLMAFRNAGESILPRLISTKASMLASKDTVPPKPASKNIKPPPPPFAIIPDSKPMPPPPPNSNVKQIHVGNNAKATVIFKNGKTEIYDLTKPAESKAFAKKYGGPPKPPTVIEDIVVNETENIDEAPVVAVEPVEPVSASVSTTVSANVKSPAAVATAPMKTSVNVKSSNSANMAAPAEAESIEIDGEVLLNLTSRSTQADIDKQVAKIKEMGYIIEVQNVQFLNGKLVGIEGTLGNKNKKSHFKAADFKELYFTVGDDKTEEPGIKFYVIKGKLNIN